MRSHEEHAMALGPSFPYAAILVVFAILLAVAYAGRHSLWGLIPHMLAAGLVLWGGYEALNAKSYAHIHRQYPDETRLNWAINNLLCFVVFPGLLWLVFGLPMLATWLVR
jgi:hypothetical protein